MINKRLKQIADFTNNNSNVIDVGCDHAYLSIYLIKNNIAKSVIASDLNKGPLDIAITNIKKDNLEDKITVSLGYGIETIKKETDTVIISGMGGVTINEILTKDEKLLSNVNTLILSPNSEHYEVRKKLTDLGYLILDEVIIKEKNKYYLIIKAKKGNKDYSEIELKYGPVLIKQKTLIFIEYCNYLIDKYQKILIGIPKNKTDNINKEIDNIKKIIDK